MPYDSFDTVSQQSILLSELLRVFRRRVTFARQKEFHKATLDSFANTCLEKSITCITFNYDDVLLYEEVQPIRQGSPWHAYPKTLAS